MMSRATAAVYATSWLASLALTFILQGLLGRQPLPAAPPLALLGVGVVLLGVGLLVRRRVGGHWALAALTGLLFGLGLAALIAAVAVLMVRPA